MVSVLSGTADIEVAPVGGVRQWYEVEEEELEAYLQRLFAIGDKNGDGSLQPGEFLDLLMRSAETAWQTP